MLNGKSAPYFTVLIAGSAALEYTNRCLILISGQKLTGLSAFC